MAYADQQMSGNKVTALVIVAILHVAAGYALVTGLAYEAVQKIKERVTAVDIKEEKPPEEPPPPPPDEPVTPPPIVAPPPPIAINRTAPDIRVVDNIPPPAPPVPIAIPAPAAPPAPVAPPPPRFTPKGATPKGNPGSWQRESDYPSAALREDRSGTTGVTVQVGPDGRVAGCSVSKSSGSPDLDAAACKLITRSGRFNPATDGEGNPTTGTWRSSVRWQIPE